HSVTTPEQLRKRDSAPRPSSAPRPFSIRSTFQEIEMNKGTAIVGFFLCFLAGMFLMWGIARSKGGGIEAEPNRREGVDHSGAAIPVSAKDPTWGNGDAPVTIVEF